MVGWSTLLRTGSVPPGQQERALEAIERNARVQARLIEDMLDLARIEQGKLVLSVGPLELVRVVEAAIDAVRPAAEAKQIRLQPVLDSHATIVGDADRLQQVVWNLLSNAIKFTPKGGRVQVRLHREPSFVEIAVADNGRGSMRGSSSRLRALPSGRSLVHSQDGGPRAGTRDRALAGGAPRW